jgi:hypothetical protein
MRDKSLIAINVEETKNFIPVLKKKKLLKKILKLQRSYQEIDYMNILSFVIPNTILMRGKKESGKNEIVAKCGNLHL